MLQRRASSSAKPFPVNALSQSMSTAGKLVANEVARRPSYPLGALDRIHRFDQEVVHRSGRIEGFRGLAWSGLAPDGAHAVIESGMKQNPDGHSSIACHDLNAVLSAECLCNLLGREVPVVVQISVARDVPAAVVRPDVERQSPM